MKTHKLLLSLFVGALAVVGLLASLNLDRAAADVPREWDGPWYWKDGGWIDYAPSGVPDFDQKQDAWFPVGGPGPPWSYCGPVAAANSLWWFDSKFEPYPVGSPGPPPSTIPYNDNYYLVTTYDPTWIYDDHDPQNVGGGPPGLVDDLAWYFDTDGQRSGSPIQGTEIHAMSHGLQWYLYGGNPAWLLPPYNPPTAGPSPPFGYRYYSYYDDYHVQLVKMPTFEWVEEEVERSEDVILLLGFWQEQTGGWKRLGGHYVTVAGINSTDLQIAFSDPYTDAAESGAPGRVLSGALINHVPIPGHPSTVHNDAGNVSHDIYTVTLMAVSPGGAWEIKDYPYTPGTLEMMNAPEEFVPEQGEYMPGPPVFAEVEYALAMSPFYWKPGGEWVDTWWMGQWITEWWAYEDDGDSCLPDFAWGGGDAWYDGPTALANSLWWFDSKAETLKTGGWPVAPPTISDHYDLLTAYGAWDDHAVTNTMLFIGDLASYLNTTPAGTTRSGMANGIGAYLKARGVDDDFYTKTQDAPSFEWVADEVETCEDVIMLLGFYENIDDSWERKGGHWVNAAGVNRDNGLIGTSDPYTDSGYVESFFDVVHMGRVFPPEHLGTPFTVDEKRDPQAISHDIYAVAASSVPGYEWALEDYPATTMITDFIDLNGGGFLWTYNPISTVVEWAVGVSPHSDLIITKTAEVTEVDPGDRVTYTLEYANTGLAAAHNVVISDLLDIANLTDIAYTSDPPIQATPGVTYVWMLPKLSYGQKGEITITAEALNSTTLENTSYITGLNSIGGLTPDRNLWNNTSPRQVGTIIVEKRTIEPENPGTQFDFIGDAAGTIVHGGQIVVTDLPPGTYTSTEQPKVFWDLIAIECDDADSSGDPDPGTRTATFQVEAGETVKCVFTNTAETDFGDAPDSYGTLRASDGARHTHEPGHYLGSPSDTELDGQPSVNALGDDNNPVGLPDDEDGVTLPLVFTQGDPAATVVVDGGPSGGMLDAWVDFNGNGVFDHASEHLWGGVSQPLNAGVNPPLSFAVPACAQPGATYARFRLSDSGALSPTGWVNVGEVEDYTATIESGTGDITIVKDAEPADGTDFEFGGDLREFTLDDADPDDGDLIYDHEYFYDLTTGDYVVTETLPAGWALTEVFCEGGDYDLIENGVVIHLLCADDDITCTFHNGTSTAIGGKTAPASMFALLAPWIVLAALTVVIAAAAFARKKRTA